MAPAGHNEAPAIFKKSDGTYWMITSGCTGWDPNEARMFSAPSIWGPWTQHPNPCRGENQKSLLADRVPMCFRYRERKMPLSLWQISGGLSIRVMPVISGCPYSLKMECLISNGWIVGRSISLIRNNQNHQCLLINLLTGIGGFIVYRDKISFVFSSDILWGPFHTHL